MKYLKNYEGHSAVANYNAGVHIPPTVCYTEVDDTVRYMEKPKYSLHTYFTFTALEDGTFTLTIPSTVGTSYITSISYSTDNGVTWTTTNNSSSNVVITTPTITAGNKVLWKGIARKMAGADDNNYSHFTSTGNFDVSGNIMSLLYGDDYNDEQSNVDCLSPRLFENASKLRDASCLYLPSIKLGQLAYMRMFLGCTGLIAAPKLPAVDLQPYCYGRMFSGCTSLTSTPALPATTLTQGCYSNMFYRCTSLTTAPTLPATTLKNYCYQGMFYGCTSLTTAPTLPATTLAYNCYQNMFQNCTSLTTAPTLPATTLPVHCYQEMFSGCSSLNYIKAMFTTTPSSSYTSNWVQNVSSTGTFVKNSAAAWNVTGANGIPSGWTVQTATS